MSSVARIKFIKTKVIFSYHNKGVSNQVSSYSDHEIKSCSCSNSGTKMGKNEKVGKIFWITKRGNIRGLQIGAGFRDYKLGQEGLQIEIKEISNWGKRDLSRGTDYKSGQSKFTFLHFSFVNPEVHLEPCQTFVIKLFAKIIKCKSL